MDDAENDLLAITQPLRSIASEVMRFRDLTGITTTLDLPSLDLQVAALRTALEGLDDGHGKLLQTLLTLSDAVEDLAKKNA